MLTDEQRAAAERAFGGHNLFITGAAGTGKSFLLRYIIQEFEKRHPGKVAVTAPTGIAAVNVGGQTVHSFAGIGVWQGEQPRSMERALLGRVKKSPASTKRWQETQTLIIDEISMLEPSLFEQLEFIAKEIRQCRGRGFGGLQVILCGDFLQLPPVEVDRDHQAKRFSFCFETPAWNRCALQQGMIMLCQPVRQSGDVQFVQFLNEVRLGKFSPLVAQICNQCSVSVKPVPQDFILPTKLYCTNRDVDKENESRLSTLSGEQVTFTAQDAFYQLGNGTPGRAKDEEKKLADILSKKVSFRLNLKLQAQVILTKKMHAHGLVNGSRGVVVDFHERGVSVKFDTGQVVKVERETFQQNGSSQTLYRKQLPLRLGWALTIHKSQGMTLSRAEVQLDDAFSYGQAYVALSRLTSFAGLWIGGRGVTQRSIMAHPTALKFYGY